MGIRSDAACRCGKWMLVLKLRIAEAEIAVIVEGGG
jgi:hypothetical protein